MLGGSANGYDSDGVFTGPPATTAAHHASAGTARRVL